MRETRWLIYAQSGALTVEGLQQAELAQPATDFLENKKEGGQQGALSSRPHDRKRAAAGRARLHVIDGATLLI
jgi:hypothetical protein